MVSFYFLIVSKDFFFFSVIITTRSMRWLILFLSSSLVVRNSSLRWISYKWTILGSEPVLCIYNAMSLRTELCSRVMRCVMLTNNFND
jgi:hypothetical protein